MGTRYRIADHVAWVEGEVGRIVLLDLTRLDAAPLVLADSAAAVWRCVAEPSTGGSVPSQVAAAYGLSAQEVADDVQSFLTDLTDRGLLLAAD